MKISHLAIIQLAAFSQVTNKSGVFGKDVGVGFRDRRGSGGESQKGGDEDDVMASTYTIGGGDDTAYAYDYKDGMTLDDYIVGGGDTVYDNRRHSGEEGGRKEALFGDAYGMTMYHNDDGDLLEKADSHDRQALGSKADVGGSVKGDIDMMNMISDQTLIVNDFYSGDTINSHFKNNGEDVDEGVISNEEEKDNGDGDVTTGHGSDEENNDIVSFGETGTGTTDNKLSEKDDFLSKVDDSSSDVTITAHFKNNGEDIDEGVISNEEEKDNSDQDDAVITGSGGNEEEIGGGGGIASFEEPGTMDNKLSEKDDFLSDDNKAGNKENADNFFDKDSNAVSDDNKTTRINGIYGDNNKNGGMIIQDRRIGGIGGTDISKGKGKNQADTFKDSDVIVAHKALPHLNGQRPLLAAPVVGSPVSTTGPTGIESEGIVFSQDAGSINNIGRNLVYAGVYEDPVKIDALKNNMMVGPRFKLFDDGPHFNGVRSIAFSKGKHGYINSIKLTYREDGPGAKHGLDGNYPVNVELGPQEEIVSVTIGVYMEKALLTWIKFETSTGRIIDSTSFGKGKGGKGKGNKVVTKKFTAPVGYVLGGIHSIVNVGNNGEVKELATMGTYWVVKSTIGLVSQGNILIDPGSSFLNDETITQHIPEVTTITDALAWIEADRMKEFQERNPVILWQINPPGSGYSGLLVHRQRFLEQSAVINLPVSSARDFAVYTADMLLAQTQGDNIFSPWQPQIDAAFDAVGTDQAPLSGINVHYNVGAGCVGDGPENSSCNNASECCSELCHSDQCVHCLPAGGECANDGDCCEWLWCDEDNICIEAPSSSPSDVPSTFPSKMPSKQPSSMPSEEPSSVPSVEPSNEPSVVPSTIPSSLPSFEPSLQPTLVPSSMPSSLPSLEPSGVPSVVPTITPRYDARPCEKDSHCISGICSANKKCGMMLNVFQNDLSGPSLPLSHSVQYGINQYREGGGCIVFDDGNSVQMDGGNSVRMDGNVWKAFPFEYTVTRKTVLEFEFTLTTKAEGHAICLDEDIDEDVELANEKRCFRLAGTQADQWKEVWNLEEQGINPTKTYKINIGDFVDETSTPYINPGTQIKFLAIIQDNDKDPEVGESVFSNIQIYEDILETNRYTTALCTKRNDLRLIYNNMIDDIPSDLLYDTRTVLRWDGNNFGSGMCPYYDNSISYFKNVAISETAKTRFRWSFGIFGTHSLTEEKDLTDATVKLYFLPMRYCNYFDEDTSIYDIQDTASPTEVVSASPSETPSLVPSFSVSPSQSSSPTSMASISQEPSGSLTPSFQPSKLPTSFPSETPSTSTLPSSSRSPSSKPTNSNSPTVILTNDFIFQLFNKSDDQYRYKSLGIEDGTGIELCLGDSTITVDAARSLGIEHPGDVQYYIPLFECNSDNNPVRDLIDTMEDNRNSYEAGLDDAEDELFDSFFSFYNRDVAYEQKPSSRALSVLDNYWGKAAQLEQGSEVLWSPNKCSCNQEPNTITGTCENVDGCFYNEGFCGQNSQCDESKTFCRCDAGYLNSEDSTRRVDSSSGDTCIKALYANQDVTGESFMIAVNNGDVNAKSFKIDCTRIDSMEPDKEPEKVFPHDSLTILADSSAAVFEYNFTGLRPGGKYKATLFPLDNNDAEIPTDVTFNTTAVTHCCCDCNPSKPTDVTGRPLDFKVHQVDGHVMFNFTDNSRCAEAYAFSRAILNEEFEKHDEENKKAVFTPNYYYFAKKKCSGAPISPGLGASDDLRISELMVGNGYRYCVRAVAQFYSENPLEESGDTLYSSDETCQVHYVRWQASLHGRVTTEPEAGSLPIESVEVSWELLDTSQTEVLASDSFVTEEGGSVTIPFDVLNEHLDSDREFPVRIRFSKSTPIINGTIKHTFLCNDGGVNCTDDGTVVFLKHLEFEKPFFVYDDTAVPFKGRVVVSGTDSEESGDGCPIIGAEVCLIDKYARAGDTRGICVPTDFNGDYEAPAIIGTTVSLEVNYNNHTFIPTFENPWRNNYAKGILVDVNNRYERHDFMDMTEANLFVEVAGGLCNHTLGKSTIIVKVSGGCLWEKILTQDSFKAAHRVPAHILDVRVDNVGDDEDRPRVNINTVFGAPENTKTIDLLNAQAEEEIVEDMSEEEDSTLEEEEEDSLLEQQELVRFQYNGDLEIAFQLLGKDLNENCPAEEADTTTSYSLHATPVQELFNIVLFVKYKILDDDDDDPLYCDIVSDDMKVRVYNQVGVDDFPSYDSFAGALDTVTKNQLEICSAEQDEEDINKANGETDGGFCEFEVEHDTVNGVKSAAKMTPRSNEDKQLPFLTGRPNYLPPYTKSLTLRVTDPFNNGVTKVHVAEFIVEGDFDLGPGASFALPTYEPLLVLRDPPGGKSFASYTNVQSTIKVKSDSVERMDGFDATLKVGAIGNAETAACFGGGFGAIALVCNEVVGSQVAGLGEGSGGGDFVTIKKENTHTGEFTTTWSYTTSDDPLLAGRQSDVFVVPNLNVEYHKVWNIDFDVDNCNVTAVQTVKFDLKDPKNKPTFSFLNVYNIEKHQIIELSESKILLEEEYERVYLANNLTNDTFVSQIQALDDALLGWTSSIEEYDETNELAKAGSLGIAPREWFSSWVADNDKGDDEPLPQDHWSSLVPEKLADRANAFDFDYIEEAGLGDGEDLKTTNRIHFSGGGATMEFSMDHKQIDENLQRDPGAAPDDNSVGRGKVEVEGDTEVKILGVGFKLEGNADYHFEVTHSMTMTDTEESETTVSFTFGDDDKEDEFVTDIYIDPKHGTFVFPLISGRSKNPHEPNTEWNEVPIIEVIPEFIPSRPVLPEQEMVFKMKVANLGFSDSGFEIFLDHTTNDRGLSVSLSGSSLRTPIGYFITAETILEQDLTIRRGPEEYMYEPLIIVMIGEWDGQYNLEASTTTLYNYVDEEDKQWIKFEQPCQRVEWAGKLKRDNGFLINKEIDAVDLVVYNPSRSLGTFELLANTTRLNTVLIWYRELGEVEWVKAYATVDNSVTFFDVAAPGKEEWKEDGYGYSIISWETGNILTRDGMYELKVETVCDTVLGAPDDFNSYSATPIIGVVDTVEPKMYGSSLPLGDVVLPGEEIIIMFTEPILCEQPYRFEISVNVSGINLPFDERNGLNVFCEGRKLSFQFDQTDVAYDDLIGREMNVTIAGVSDRHQNKMNELSPPIRFTKTLANLNLDEVSTRFLLTTKAGNCHQGTLNATEFQTQIADILSLPEPSRIEIERHGCNDDGTNTASVTIGPRSFYGGVRRHLSSTEDHAIGLVYSLMGTNPAIDSKQRRRELANDGVKFQVGQMKIVPGPTDAKLLESNADLKLQEEMILSGICDENVLLQQKQMQKMEDKVEKKFQQSNFHIDEVLEQVQQSDSHINEMLEQIQIRFERQQTRLVEMMLVGVLVGVAVLMLVAAIFIRKEGRGNCICV